MMPARAALPCLMALCTVGIGLSAPQAQAVTIAPRPATAEEDHQRCAKQADAALRLACYDALFAPRSADPLTAPATPADVVTETTAPSVAGAVSGSAERGANNAS